MSIEIEDSLLKIRLLNAVRDRIIKFGYRNLRIDDIANDLQISKRTIYEIFTSKEEMVREFFEYSHKQFGDEINNAISIILKEDKGAFLIELRRIWEIVKKHSEILSNVQFAELKTIFPDLNEECKQFENVMREKFHTVFRRGIELGVIKPDMRSEIFYLIHFHALNSLFKPEILSQIPLSINDIIEGSFNVLLTGVLTEDSQKEYHLLSGN